MTGPALSRINSVVVLARTAGAYLLCELGPILWPFLRSSARDSTMKAVRGTVAIIIGPQTLYETKPHMKQHCCCTWQGHPWLAISTVVAAENRPKDDVVSCRVCFVSVDIVGGMCGPNLMKDREAVVSRWVCGFMLGLERFL